VLLTGVGSPPRPSAPGVDLAVSPNPSVRGERIHLAAARAGEFREVRLFDVAGRVERSLALGEDGAAEWDGRDAGGAPVRPGVPPVRQIGAAGSAGTASRVILVH